MNTPSLLSISQRSYSCKVTHLVGKLITSLSAKTTQTQIDALATLTPEELIQHTTLNTSLKENNPKEKAAQLRLQARRVAAIAANAITKGALVDQSVVTKLRELANDYRTAQTAAALAATQFKDSENLLPGTGGEAWRELFDAARKFALESHPNKAFPELRHRRSVPALPTASNGRRQTSTTLRGLHTAGSGKNL